MTTCAEACQTTSRSHLVTMICKCSVNTKRQLPTSHQRPTNHLQHDVTLFKQLLSGVHGNRGMTKRQDQFFDYNLDLPWSSHYGNNGDEAVEEHNKKVFRYGRR